MAVNNLNKVKIPGTGTTAARPSNPAVGDTYYNGTLGRLEIYTSQGWMALSAPPQTPTGVTATDAGSGRAYNNGSASIAFTPATAGGLPTSYVVTSSPGSYTATGSVSPIIVSGQQSNTSYTYTVVASNDYATASTSSASSAVTATTVPQAPTIGAVTGGNALATVAYTANGTGGLSNTYTATSNPGGFTGTGSSPITISGLTNETSYTFTVTATNANGTSAASSASSSVTPSANVTVEYLVVAGGGAGGAGSGTNTAGGGGGCAGGYRTGTFTDRVISTNYTVTVGAGGTCPTAVASNGSNSVFSTITSTGGGRGSGLNGGSYSANTGGSGGGSSYWGSAASGNTPSTTPSQGNNGYDGLTSGVGGGGGGAGAAGDTKNGGSGSASSISGSSVTYAGGGGGGVAFNINAGAVPGSGGGGGGGSGGNENQNGNNGSINTGGGGGATGSNASVGGSGGSGIVIFRYPITNTITIGAGLTGSTATDGSYKVTTITAGTGNVSWA
jgi:hypothetical protein